MNHVGIDLGGTKIEGILVDSDYTEIRRKRIPTPADYPGILSAICGMIEELDSRESTVGVCTPGITHRQTGLIRNSNTQCLTGMPFQADLRRLTGRSISMENDANCFTLAESRLGAARGHKVVFGVIMGTGVGGGIVIDDTIQKGRSGIAGEWGHHTLYPGGNECYCGRRGCVETYISGPALEDRWRELTGDSRPLAETKEGMHISGADKWKGEFLDNFGAGLANVIDILDPDVIVLGGGVSNVEFLYDEGAQAVRSRVFGGFADTPILRNKLGDSAGVFGACMI